MQDPDSSLIRESQAGSKSAFAALVERYYEKVYAIAYGILRERESARDVTQEVFLKVYREISGFESRAKFSTWLHRIVVNAALDEIRKKRPAESIDETPEEGEGQKPPIQLADTGPGPREEASRREMGEAIERALGRLSPEHRAIMVLREWEGLSYEEIAETLGIEVGTVMSRLFYARKKMAEMIALSFPRKRESRRGSPPSRG